jgi:MYXO-CTERM domain-containing protein
MRRNLALMAVAMGAAGAALWAPDAQACGGCFGPPTPPGQDVEVVTDHRMILSVSPQQTTLYDEIQYSGSPASFAWVLPINGQVTVGLSSDSLFKTLDTLTQTTVESPPTDCPGLPSSCQSESPGGEFGGAGSASDAGTAAVPVTVLSTAVVGPYETAQLQSTDPTALEDWLTSHGYDIPADIEPVIAAYVAQSFDFLAMKLVPGAGVQSMRPVRVTTQGATIALPLRMVAAGTGATVGITLWMLGDGRYEPSNFSYFHIDDADITWDWTTQSSNYTTLRQQHETALNGAGWEIESSTEQSQQQITGYLTSLEQSFSFAPDGGSDYAPETAADGGISGSASQAQADDLSTLFSGIGVSGGQVRITRIRSDLAHTALGSDLQLTASADQSVLPNVRQPGLQSGEPECPVYDSQCNYIGQEPRDQAIASMAGLSTAGGGGCATASDRAESGSTWLTVAALAGLVFAGARRRRRA